MKFPVENNQFAARLTGEDLTLLNELIPELLPDRDLTDSTITGREVFMAMAETASLKLRKVNQSKPDDLAKIEQLTAENAQMLKDKLQLNVQIETVKAQAQAHETEIVSLQELNDDLETRLGGLVSEHLQVSEKASNLQKYAPVPNEMRIVVEPLTSRLLSLYAEKIRLRTKTETTPGEILISLFNRYIVRRETELPGFPFLVSKQEIANLASELNNE
jgi:hypothetical protein